MRKSFRNWKRAPAFIISFFAVTFFAISGVTTDVASKTADKSQKTIPTYMLALQDAINKAFSVLESIEKEKGIGSEDKVQKFVELLKVVRYGPEKKDYFQIFDMQGRLVMDPYRPDYIGKDFSNFKDRNGTQFFVEMLKIIRKTGQGFIEHLWPLYDLETPILITSLARAYHPWGFIVVTSIGKKDIEAYEEPIVELYIPLDTQTFRSENRAVSSP